MTVLIDHNAKAAEYDRLADTIAKDLIPWKQDAPRFASQLIRNGTVNLLMMIASIFDKPLDDILKDRDTVAELANAGFFSEVMEKVLERIDVRFNYALILDEPFTGNKLHNWITSIQADFVRCVTYFIYEGATPDCCRKYIDKIEGLKKLSADFTPMKSMADYTEKIQYFSEQAEDMFGLYIDTIRLERGNSMFCRYWKVDMKTSGCKKPKDDIDKQLHTENLSNGESTERLPDDTSQHRRG
jgi:hypothetical protein